MNKIEFDPERCEGQEAIVVSFDVSGFSEFCNQPEAYRVLHRFLSAMFDELDRLLSRKPESFNNWPRHIPREKLPAPDFEKFTGDGALMIWLESRPKRFEEPFRSLLVYVMRQFRQEFPNAVKEWEREWGYVGLPKKVRVGIARGTVYPLREKSDGLTFFEEPIKDFAGYCINLAVRLQDHCPEVGFIMNGALQPSCFSGLRPCRAVGVKGVRDVPVILFGQDWDSLGADLQHTKFAG
jgi:class 3 adenylate cyclase